jgi:hypothetical protein
MPEEVVVELSLQGQLVEMAALVGVERADLTQQMQLVEQLILEVVVEEDVDRLPLEELVDLASSS